MTPIEHRLGAWLSAALDDPTICSEMKDDINAWLQSVQADPFEPPPVSSISYHLNTVLTPTGIFLRDYFAAHALMGLLSSRNVVRPHFSPEDDAAYVFKIADAMLVARGLPDPKE